MNKIRIVLISDNLTRDYLSLQYVKEALEKERNLEVYIIGSIAELQLTYYLLYKIRPHIVFVSQVLERCFRDVCSYVHESHGIVVVLPFELSYSSRAEISVLNRNLKYNELLDLYLVPGKKTQDDLITFGISNNKIRKVGSPKTDLLVRDWRRFTSRKKFLRINHIPENKKNIFIYSTLIKTPEEYIREDVAFLGHQNEAIRLSRDMDIIIHKYNKTLSQLCIDFSMYNFIVKPHPLETIKWYEGITAQNFFVITNEYVVNTMKSIDLAIHWYSTVAVECWVHGIKTIQYMPLAQYKSMLGEFHPGNPVVSSYDQLRRTIAFYMNNPLEKQYLHFQQQYITQWFGKLDGKCGRRITNEVMKMIKKSSSSQPYYVRKHSYLMYIMFLIERIMGKTISRRIVSYVRPYKWKYAAENAVYISPFEKKKHTD